MKNKKGSYDYLELIISCLFIEKINFNLILFFTSKVKYFLKMK